MTEKEPFHLESWQQDYLARVYEQGGPTSSAVNTPCPRRQCRGRLPHSWFVHWFGWVRR